MGLPNRYENKLPSFRFESKVLLTLLLSISFLLGACTSKNGGQTSAKGPPIATLKSAESVEEASGIDIIVDATPSMLGFANGPRYRTLVTQSLANAAVEGVPQYYYRLSTALPNGIRQVEDKMKVINQAFYAHGDTKLQTAIDSMRADRLTVLVTDLFQTSADMNSVSQTITRRVMQKGLAVGLFGVRLPFEGRIYDVGFDSRSFSFTGNRPLYGLVFGESETVSQYFSNLQKYVNQKKYRFLLLSPRPVRESIQIKSIDSLDNLVRVKPNIDHSLPDERTISVKARNNNQLSRLKSTIEVNFLPFTKVLLNKSSLQSSITKVWKYNSNSDKFEDKFNGINSASKALTPKISTTGDRWRFKTIIRPQELRRGKYCFNLVIRIKHWSLPKWVSKWNLSPSQFQSEKLDGDKTQNLRPFLVNIASSITNTDPPMIGSLQVFVEKTD